MPVAGNRQTWTLTIAMAAADAKRYQGQLATAAIVVLRDPAAADAPR